MVKQHKSVSDMVKRLSGDEAFAKKFEQEIAEKQLAKMLFAMRCTNGMSQKEMASKLGCTQSRISKLEHARTDDIRIGDLSVYAEALGLNLSVSFHEPMSSVERVKFHAFKIKKYLDELAILAHRDDKIFDGIKSFYKEYLVNILALFKDSAEKLPRKPRTKKGPVLKVNPPINVDAMEELLLEA